ncbi:MAG: peptidase inhibitor family I36 protein [Proteobacteria bacterium]|nr:peptidase inhibitor family I36 protein [Pseudomonadota bacterium]
MLSVRAIASFAAPALLSLCAAAPASAQAAAGGVCFFEHINYEGRPYCIAPGQSVPNVGGFNDQFSSVNIPPGVRVRMCEHANFTGRCITLDRPTPNFVAIGFNDIVTAVAADMIGAPGHAEQSPRHHPPAIAAPQPHRPDFGDRHARGRDFDPPPPRAPEFGDRGRDHGHGRDDLREQMSDLRAGCEAGDRRSCVRLGIIIGENRERRAQWRRERPDFFFWER